MCILPGRGPRSRDAAAPVSGSGTRILGLALGPPGVSGGCTRTGTGNSASGPPEHFPVCPGRRFWANTLLMASPCSWAVNAAPASVPGLGEWPAAQKQMRLRNFHSEGSACHLVTKLERSVVKTKPNWPLDHSCHLPVPAGLQPCSPGR